MECYISIIDELDEALRRAESDLEALAEETGDQKVHRFATDTVSGLRTIRLKDILHFDQRRRVRLLLSS